MPSPENEEVATNEIQITESPNTSAMPITTAKIVKVGFVEDEGDLDNKSTGAITYEVST